MEAVSSRTAAALRELYAEEARGGGPLVELAWELLGFFPLMGEGLDFFFREAPRGVSNLQIG